MKSEASDLLLMGVIVAFAWAYRSAVEAWFQVDIDPNNEELLRSANLPLLVLQISHNVLAIARVAKLGILIFLVLRWKQNWARAALFVWLVAEVGQTLSILGARTYAAMLILAAMVTYHRLVKPFTFKTLSLLSAAFLFALIGYGFLREYGRGDIVGIENPLVAANEFQVLMTTPIHIKWLMDRGAITEVPWELIFSDFLMLIPQQFLSFPKLDPSTWYLSQIGHDPQTGLMFGVVSQGLVGGGLVELVLRSIVLAAILAGIHRLYVKRAESFLLTLFYVWLLTVVYYTYRSTTFFVLTYVLYQFIPVMLFYLAGSALLSNRTRRRSVTAIDHPALR